MILLDANVLLYAWDSTAPAHATVARWLEDRLASEADVRLSTTVAMAFVRIATDPRVYAEPLPAREAIEVVSELLARPNVSLACPTARHWAVLATLAEDGQARGPLLMDAHLAALALEHGATLATTDRGIRRFRGVPLVDPSKA